MPKTRVWPAGKPVWASFLAPPVPQVVQECAYFHHVITTSSGFIFSFLFQVTVLTLELVSPTLPAGKRIHVNIQNPAQLAEIKKTPLVIKEGIEYKLASSSYLLGLVLILLILACGSLSRSTTASFP
jgi:hypothetical protein